MTIIFEHPGSGVKRTICSLHNNQNIHRKGSRKYFSKPAKKSFNSNKTNAPFLVHNICVGQENLSISTFYLKMFHSVNIFSLNSQ